MRRSICNLALCVNEKGSDWGLFLREGTKIEEIGTNVSLEPVSFFLRMGDRQIILDRVGDERALYSRTSVFRLGRSLNRAQEVVKLRGMRFPGRGENRQAK